VNQNKRKEMEIIKNILHNNQYTTNVQIRKAKKKGSNNTQIVKNSTYTKWLTFAYTGKQTKDTTEEFENRSLKLLFRINSTTGNLSKYNNNNNNNNFYNVKESSIYQLICPNCNKRYIGHK
jgi:hypothetical protein